jgi:hypothetical protein
MLRITVLDNSGTVTFRVEGRLAGPWVKELATCWQNTLGGRGSGRATQQSPLRFDLTSVTFVDAAGKAFLAARHAEGAELVACGCLMRAVVAEISSARVVNAGLEEEPRT